MLVKRIITALIGIPIIVFIVWQGRSLLLLVTLISMVLGLIELEGMFTRKQIKIMKKTTLIFASLMVLQTYIYNDNYLEALVLIYLILLYSFMIYNKKDISTLVFSIFSILYIPFLMRYILLIRELANGHLLLITILVLTWASDTGAYFVGKRIGKRKLCPAISPNKTVEGSIGSIFFSVVFSFLIGHQILNFNVMQSFFMGIVISVSGQLGDLFESYIKRNMGVKDSGNILPGHGGILDRIDSLLFTVPVSYLLFNTFF